MDFILAIFIIAFLVVMTIRGMMNNRVKKHMWIFYWAIAVIMIVNFVFSKTIFDQEFSIKDPVRTTARIIGITEVGSYRSRNKYFILSGGRHGGVKQTYYRRKVKYLYVIDKIEYVREGVIESTNRNDVEDIKDDIIQIKYDKDNPQNSVIEQPSDNTANGFNIITIVIFVGMGIILKMGSTPLKEKEELK